MIHKANIMINNIFWRTALAAIPKFLAQAILVAGCSTLQPLEINNANPLAQSIQIGEKVRITLHDDSVLRFKVTEVDADRIAGDGHSVPLGAIRKLEVRRPDAAATRKLVIALAAAGLAAVAVSSTLVAVTW